MRTPLLAAILAAAAAPVHADPGTWQFTYTGFLQTIDAYDRDGSTHTETLLPDYTIGGSFSGADLDGDGVIVQSELTGFSVRGTDYFYCMANPSAYGSCGLSGFRYAADGTLDFSAGWSGHDEYYSGWSGGVTAGREASDYSYGPFSESTYVYRWTDATRLDILPPPVPEPSHAAMALAGLLVLALRRFGRA